MCQASTATWVDDVACAITAPAPQLMRKTSKAISIILDIMTEHGLQLTFGVGKTAVLPSFHGPGAVQSRQECEKSFPHTIPVCSEFLGIVNVPLTNHYKHLGGMIMRNGHLLPEVKIRGALMYSKLKPLRKILSNDQIEVRQRRTLMTTMGMSVLTLHTGAWFDLKWGEYHAWKASVYGMYRMLQKLDWDSDRHHDLFHLAWYADSPMPLELLHLNRLRLWIHIVQVGDEFMISAVVHNHRWAGDRSWLASVLQSFQWLREQVSTQLVPPEIERLCNPQTWRELQPHVTYFKKLIRKAKRCHLHRVKTLCLLSDHAEFQKGVLCDMNLQCTSEEVAQPWQDVCRCDQCDKEFPTQAALAVHQTKQHNQKMAIRRFATDPNCRICARHFHTRARLLTHWQYGSTPCWVAMMRCYKPMSEADAQSLDDADKRNGQALHQRGIKAPEIDRQWRPCTSEELKDALDRQDHQDGYDTSVPTEQELVLWREFGMLPPGQGGRDKTVRQVKDPRVCNVVAATRQFEVDMCKRAASWIEMDDWIPRPLAQGQRYVLIFFSGHRRFGDICSWLEWEGNIQPIPIDLAICKTRLIGDGDGPLGHRVHVGKLSPILIQALPWLFQLFQNLGQCRKVFVSSSEIRVILRLELLQ